MSNSTMNKRELAAAMRVSTTTVDNWLNRGCPFRKAPDGATVGEGYQFDLAEVQHWLDHRDRRVVGHHGAGSGRTWKDALRWRPDWRNDLRFFAENAVLDYLGHYWERPSNRVFVYSMLRCQGATPEDARYVASEVACSLFKGLFEWIQSDHLNKTLRKHGSSLDENYQLMTGERVATRPPIDDDSIGRSLGLPSWVRLDDDDYGAELEAEYQKLMAQLEAKHAQASAD